MRLASQCLCGCVAMEVLFTSPICYSFFDSTALQLLLSVCFFICFLSTALRCYFCYSLSSIARVLASVEKGSVPAPLVAI